MRVFGDQGSSCGHNQVGQERSAGTPLPQFSPTLRRDVRSGSSGDQIVTMMQTAKSRRRYKPMAAAGIPLCLTTGRRSFLQRQMRSVLVVIADELIHEALQVPFVHYDRMVEHISAAIADPALGNTVLPWASETCSLRLDAEALYCPDDFFIEVGTAIKDRIGGCRVVRERLAQLLNHPCTARMFGHIAVKNTAPVMGHDQEAVENAKGERRHGKQIHRRNGFTMIAQKTSPSDRKSTRL